MALKILGALLALLSLLLAWHAANAVTTGVMPMRVSAAHKASRPQAFWAAVGIEGVLAVGAMAGAIAFGLM
jgi:hypothetical protein